MELSTGNRFNLSHCHTLIKISQSLRLYGCCSLNVLSAVMMVVLNLLAGPFLQAVVDKDGKAMIFWFCIGAPIFVVISVIISYTQYLGEKIRLDWRAAIVDELHKLYFKSKLLYWLNNIDKRIDNADQRMTQEYEYHHICELMLF